MLHFCGFHICGRYGVLSLLHQTVCVLHQMRFVFYKLVNTLFNVMFILDLEDVRRAKNMV